MGGFSGKYSRNPFATFEEEKNYAFPLMQEGIPVTDDDENAGRLQLLHQFRRGNQLFGDYGTPNDGFQIKEATAPANDFKITGGGPSNTDIEAAGRFFMRGHQCVLMHDITYYNARSDISEQSIHPRITRVYLNGGNTVVEDSAANWVAAELVGRSVRIGTTNRTIADNGVDWFTITGDHTGGVDPILNLAYYILRLTPPVALTRDDGVYLNVYVDEYDENDDSTIEKQIGGVAVVAQLRAKIMQTLFVRQGVTALGELVDYVDSDGNQHYVSKLATILRTTSNDITAAMITDHVPTIGFTSIGRDHMTPLRATALSSPGNTVTVSPGVALTGAGTSIITFAGGASPTIPGQAANERYDALVLQNGGTLALVAGTPGAPPAAKPLFTGVPIAFIKVDEDPAVITDADITDARCLFTQGLVAIADLAAATGMASGDLVGIVQGGVPKNIQFKYWPFPPHHIHGLICSYNAVDPDADVDIAAGGARDTTDSANMVLSSGRTKKLDEAWAVGTNAGGLDAGVIAASTLYAVWLIKRSDTGVVDVLFSTSFTAPTMPADYDLKRLIGAIKTDSPSANIIRFKQVGDHFTYLGDSFTGPPIDIQDATIADQVWETGVLTSCPPNCLAHVIGVLYNSSSTSGLDGRLWISALPPSSWNSDPFVMAELNANFDALAGMVDVLTNSSQEIRYTASETTGSAEVRIMTISFEMLTRRDPQ